MKSTGIVRRIDDLGRIVIPKEIRRNLAIREGDPLEIFVEGEMVCYSKYEPACDVISRIKRIPDDIKSLDGEYDIRSIETNVRNIIELLGGEK